MVFFNFVFYDCWDKATQLIRLHTYIHHKDERKGLMAEGQIWIRLPILAIHNHVLVCYKFPTKHLDKIRVIRHLSIPPVSFQLGNPKSILESSSQGRKILHPKTCPSRCWPKSLATKTSNFFDLIDFTCKSFQQ